MYFLVLERKMTFRDLNPWNANAIVVSLYIITQTEHENIKVQMFTCFYMQVKIGISFFLERFTHYMIFS